MSRQVSPDESRVARVPVLVVEDEGMFRAFLEHWFRGHERYVLVGAFGSGEEVLSALPGISCDIMLVDLELPGIDGIEVIREARRFQPDIRVLVLSSHIDPLALTRVGESGAVGFIEKDASPEDLTIALDNVVAGRTHFSARYRALLGKDRRKPDAVGKILSRREQEVLSHVLAGRTSRETAELIGVSTRTIEFHRANLMAKLGAKNLADLVRVA